MIIQVTVVDSIGQIIISKVDSIEKAFELIKNIPNIETYQIEES